MAAPLRVFTRPPRPGVTLTASGAQFCVYSGHASGVELCLFDPEGQESRHPMSDVGHGFWALEVAGAGAGTRYGYRASGPWDPRAGHRYNAAKLLLDPYARAIEGEVSWRPEVFGHVVDERLQGDATLQDSRDSAPFVPRCVVVEDSFDWGADAAPAVAMADTVLYEAHVRGLTYRHPQVPQELRGTYAGLAHPAVLEHLTSLGVTSVELLPVHSFTHEPRLVRMGLSNYWGYNTLGFFAPHAAFAAADTPAGAVQEFKGMVKALHAAGLEVVLDVVYNHTAEQSGSEGATLSLRGLDNRIHYRLDEGGNDIDVTGCGNSVDTRHPATMQLVLDSLRYWVEEMHVDGFRFDLAVTLGRGPNDEYDPNDAFLMAVRTDPVLSRVKLIAEPWDIGMHGWRTGQFPPPFSEWNDRFRNTVRDFWLTDVERDANGAPGHGIGDLATRLAGSRDLFSSPYRRPQASINFVTAHDGFTLADLTMYSRKHNEANGEHNRDGTNDNRSWNHGVEGPVDPADPIAEHRLRSIRNMLGTLTLSAGVPMLTAGDEFARTQAGNNNAYCQDSPVSWVDWNHSAAQHDLIRTTKHLLALRAAHPVLRHTHFFPGNTCHGDGAADLRWFGADGEPLDWQHWADPRARTVQAFFDGWDEHEDSLLLVLHGGAEDARIRLPAEPGPSWKLLWDSSVADPGDVRDESISAGGTRLTPGTTMLVFAPGGASADGTR